MTDEIHAKTIFYDHQHFVDSRGRVISVDMDCDCEEYRDFLIKINAKG